MNRIYRHIWRASRNDFILAPEFARAKTKSGRAAGVIGAVAIASLSSAQLYAHEIDSGTLPTGATVTAGQVNIAQEGKVLTVTQDSNRAAVNWQQFSVGSDAAVNFAQPSASAAILNRVVGHEASVIDGALNANGQVFILNANGVLFGKNAQVNTAGLVASTLDISDEDFLASKFTFERTGSAASVINLGTIEVDDGKFVALLGNQVRNEGLITANLGSAVLAAGDKVSLNFNGDSLVGVTVDYGTLRALVENQQAIVADGGMIVMTAKGLEQVMETVVNNTGELRARTIEERAGRIFLGGGGDDQVAVAGSLDATAGSGKGGRIVATAGHVGVFEGSNVDASGAAGGGEIYIGGGFQGGDSAIENAKATYVAAGAELKANAGARGDGGEVVVWSDDTTRFRGKIEAQGGADSGNGGLAEVSGKRHLDFTGTADLTATVGDTGTLLLDPTDLTISATTNTNLNGDGSAADPFAPAAADAQSLLNIVTLQSALTTSNVVVSTVGSPDTTGEAGDITVADTFGWFTDRTLTLDAAGSINISQGVEMIASSGNLVLSAADSVTQDSTGNISRLRIAGTTSVTAASGSIALNSNANEFSGAVSVSAGNAIALTNNRNLILGNVQAVGLADIRTTAASNGNITNTGATSFTAANATISSGGSGFITLGNITDGVNFTGITSLGGAVNLTGLGGLSFGDISTSALEDTGVTSGNVRIAAAGDITTGDIITAGQDNIDGSGAAAGNVTITTSNGDIFLSDISAYGGLGRGAVGGGGGSVTLQTTGGNGAISVGEMDTRGGGNVVLSGVGFNGGNAGNIRIQSNNNQTITLNGDINASGGAGGGTNPTGLGGNINVTGTTVITSDREVNSGATSGTIIFSGSIDSDGATTHDLNIAAGEGDALFEGVLGGINPLGAFTVQSKNTTIRRNITADRGVSVSSGSSTIIGYSDSDSPVIINTEGDNGAISFAGSVNVQDHLTLTRGSGNIAFGSNVFGQNGVHNLTVNGTGGGDLSFSNGIAQLGNISLSTLKNLELYGPVSAQSLVYTDIGTGTARFQQVSGADSQTYSQSGGFVVRTDGDITIATGISTGTSVGGAPITAESTSGALGISVNLASNNGPIQLTGVGVSHSVDRSINAGSGTILVDGGGSTILLDGTLVTSNADTFNSVAGPAVLLRHASDITVRGVSAVNGTLQIGTPGGTPDVTGAVLQAYQNNVGLNIKTLAANTGNLITLDSSFNNIANLGAITLNGSLNVRDEVDGLVVLEDLLATQVTIFSGYGTLALGDSDVTATQGPIELRGAGITQGAGSTVDATDDTMIVWAAAPNAGHTVMDLAGTLQTTSDSATAVQVYFAFPAIIGNIITGSAGGVLLGNGAAEIGDINQTTGTAITTSNLQVISRGVVNLNGDNQVDTLSGVVNFGGFTLNDISGGLQLTGDIGGWFGNVDGAVNITTTGGALDLNARTMVGRNISLRGEGVISGTTGGAIHGGTGTILVDASGGEIDLAGLPMGTINNSATAVQFFNAGDDVVLGSINAPDGTVVLGGAGGNSIRGDITQGSTITATTLRGNTTDAVTLTNNNVIGTLADFTAGGAFSLVDSTSGLTIAGTVTTTPDTSPGPGYVPRPLVITSFGGEMNLTGSVEGDGVSLTASNGFGIGSITLAGNVQGHTGGIALVAQGTTINQTAGILATSGALSGSAVTGVNLTRNNELGQLGPFALTGSGDFTLNDATGGLQLAGNLSVNNGLTTITTAGGSLDLDEFDITTSGNLLLTGVGIGQGADSLVNATAGTVLLDAQDGAIAMAGGIATNNNTADATVVRDAATIALGSVTALSGNLTIGIAGDVTGAVTQTTGTSLNIDGLVVNTAGSVNLTGTTNRLNSLNSIVTLGDFALSDSTGGLVLEDQVQAGSGSTSGAVTIRTAKGNQAGGNLTLADFNITAFGDVTLQAQGISSSATSTINANSGAIALIGNDGVDSANGAIGLQGTLTTTNNSINAVHITRGTSLNFASITTGATGTTTFGAAGADALTGTVTQTGALVTGTLTGNSVQTTLAHADNTIANLGPYTASGAFELADSVGGLSFSGDVQTGGTTTITTPGLLSLGLFDLLATGSPLTLTANGIGQNTAGGTSTVQAGTTLLQGGTGVVELNSATNDFTGVVTLRGTGTHVQVRDANNLTLTALTDQIGSNTGVSAIAGNTLVLANEDLNTGTGDIYLQSEGGNLTTTGTLTTTTGAIGLFAAETLTVNHAITAAGGDIVLAGGNIEHNDQDVTTIGNGTITAIAIGGGLSTNTGRINMVDGTQYTTGSGDITLDAAADARVSRVATTGNVSIASSVGRILDVLIAETANISAGQLTLAGETGIGLVNDALDTEVTVLRATGNTGGIYASNAGALQLGDSNGGITTTGAGDIALSAGGAISLANNLTAADGDIDLRAAGAVSHATSANVQVTADALVVTTLADAGAAIDLSATTNTVDSVSLRSLTNDGTAPAAGGIRFASTTSFSVAAVETLGDLVLDADATVSQTGAIISDGLGLTGTGTFDLTHSANDVQRFASDATGDVDLTVATALRLGIVNPTGVNTGGADLTLVALSFDADGNTIDTRSATAGDAGGNVSITTTGGLTIAGMNTSGSDAAAASGLGGGAAGGITLTADDFLSITDNLLAAGGAGDGVGAAGAAGSLVATAPAINFAGGNVVAGSQTYSGAMTLAADTSLTALDADIEFDGTLDGTFQLTAGAGTGTITLGQAVGGTAELDELVLSAAAIRLNGGGIATSGGQSYTGTITIGADTDLAGGDLTLDGTIDSSDTAGVSDQHNLQIRSTSTTGLSIAHAIGGTHRLGALRIESVGVVTQAGSATITVARLAIRSAGNATLENAGNDVDVLAALLEGDAALSFVDADGVEIGTVTTGSLQVMGISDGGGSSNVRLVVGGLLTQAVNSPIAIGGNLSLDSTAFDAGHVTLRNTATNGTELNNSLIAGDFNLDSSVDVIQTVDANGPNADAFLQVGGNFNLTGQGEFVAGNSLDNFVAGGSAFASGNTVQLFGVVTLSMDNGNLVANATDGTNTSGTTISANDLAAGITVISSDGGQNISPVADAQAIDLGGMNNIGGSVQITTRGTYSVSAAVATGILQDGALDLASASFVVRPSASNANSNITGAGHLDLSDPGNLFSGVVALSAIGMEAHLRAAEDVVLGPVRAAQTVIELDGAASQYSITQQTGTRIVTDSLLLRNAGDTTLNSDNQIATLAASLNGDLMLTNNRTLTVGAVEGVVGITITNSDVILQTTTGDLVLTEQIAVPEDANITLVSAGNFINQAGADALQIGSGQGTGVWQVWSITPASDVLDGLRPNFKHYNADYTSTDISAITGNGLLYRYAPLLDVALTGRVEKVYDASTTATLTQDNFAITGLVAGDDVELSTAAEYDDKNVSDFNASKVVTTIGLDIDSALAVDGEGEIRIYGYQLNPASLNSDGELSANIGTITPATISNVTGITASDKTYDGTATATLQTDAAVFTGMFNGDQLAVAGASGQFASVNANANPQTVSVAGITLAGTDANNYVLTDTTATTTAVISPFAVDLAGARVYDGTRQVGAGDLQLGALVGTETLTFSGSALMADKHVGNGKALTDVSGLTLQNSTGLASNYSFTGGTHAVDITPASLALTPNDVTRTYDGTLSATGTTVATSGTQLFTDDSLSGGTFAFTNANAGTGKTVNVSNVTVNDGNGGANYQVSYTSNTNSVITPAALTISTGNLVKTYDGTAAAQGSAVVIQGTLYTNASNGNAQDSLTGGTFAFTDANAGNNKTVTVSSVTLNDGNGGGNYQVTYASNTASTINRYMVDLTGTRAYNGTWDFDAGVLTLGELVGDQTLLLSGSGTVADRNVSSGQALDSTGLALTDGENGGLAANYTLSGGAHQVDITPAALTVQVAVNDKVYDGTRTGTIAGYNLDGLVGDESLTVSQSLGGSTLFSDKNAGTDKVVTVTGITLADGSGQDVGLVGNYVFDVTTLTTTADITPKGISVAGLVAFDKIYDGTTSVRINAENAQLVGGLAGDEVDVDALTARFADKNVGTNKAVLGDALTLNGADAGNYQLELPGTLTASITPRTLAINAVGSDKVYDGSTAATVSVSDNRVSGDQLSIDYEANFLDANVGLNKYINVADIQLSGTDAGNYVSGNSVGAFANVNPRPDPIPPLIELANIGQAQIQIARNTAPNPTAPEMFIPAQTPGNVVNAPASLGLPGAAQDLLLVSAATGEPLGSAVTLTEARSMLAPAEGDDEQDGEREVRVPVSRNSLADIVNGGVRLPAGVEQQLFVVEK